MEDVFRAALEALAAAGIEAQLERNGVGQLLLTVKGQAVEGWRDDDGPWVTLVASEDADPVG